MPKFLRAGLVGALMVASAALAQDRAKIGAGAEVYTIHCAACHGERLRATGGAFDLLKLRPDERARFDRAVNDGKGQMPRWAECSMLKRSIRYGRISGLGPTVRESKAVQH
jgi:mono/diheme cytochrome c family protein